MITLTMAASEDEAAHSLIAEWATSEDHAHVALHRNSAARQNSLLARAALRALAADVTGSKDWHIRPNAQGKPELTTPSGSAGPDISWSHTKGLIVCGVSSDGPFGIDVEHWRQRDFMALAEYAFGPGEREDVARDGMPAFYRIWALREAISKITGAGLMNAMDGSDCVAASPESGFWTAGPWQLFYSSLKPGHSLAIASKGRNVWSKESLIWIDADKLTILHAMAD
jgi:4'-phosphopantetheinyl transferase